METVYHPLAGAAIGDLRKYPWPVPDLPGRGEGAEQTGKRLYEETDLALVGRFGDPIFETLMYMLGTEQWFTRLALDPDFCHTAADIITDIQIKLDRIGLEAAAKYLTVFKVSGEDFGMQNSPLYSQKMFKEMFLPYLTRRCQAARKYLDKVNPAVKIMLHRCGGIRPFIPDLIGAGIQVLDPVQPKAKDMESEQLKNDFGRQLVFHGGVDIQPVLPRGTIQEVEDETIYRIQAFGPGGGYILAPSHAVQADVSPANLVAMCETNLKYGKYPVGN